MRTDAGGADTRGLHRDRFCTYPTSKGVATDVTHRERSERVRAERLRSRLPASSWRSPPWWRWAGSSPASGETSAVGQPPPEWAANAGAWPAHNYDLSNTRATTQTPINSQTVSKLKVKWRFAFKGASALRRLRLDADRPQRHGLPPGPQLERLCARPLDRQARVAAHVQQAERRAERGRVRLRPHLRRHLDERVRARPADREAALEPQADPQQRTRAST